jgi:hypothetical protein
MEILGVRVEEVEDEVAIEQILLGAGEAGPDQGSCLHHEVEIRSLHCRRRGDDVGGYPWRQP